ncbi:MAG: serine hydrolase, partial [Thermomicrobiaceae bacterium]|nr:serine hydrolase [Thermomicrobiaceae bacterium]
MAATGAVDPMERIAALASECDAVIGVAARDFGSGAEILFNADEVFPTASTFKTLLLYELYRQVDAGRIDPAARIRFEDRHRVPGSGVLQDLDAGPSLTVKDYATLMIVVSDNSATDIVYHLLGREAIAAAVRDLGMARTYLPLDTWGILCGLFDLDPRDPAVTYAALRERLMTEQAAWECAALRETPDNDVSTPRDMLRLLEAIERGEGLTAASRAAVIDILQRQKYTNII